MNLIIEQKDCHRHGSRIDLQIHGFITGRETIGSLISCSEIISLEIFIEIHNHVRLYTDWYSFVEEN